MAKVLKFLLSIAAGFIAGTVYGQRAVSAVAAALSGITLTQIVLPAFKLPTFEFGLVAPALGVLALVVAVLSERRADAEAAAAKKAAEEAEFKARMAALNSKAAAEETARKANRKEKIEKLAKKAANYFRHGNGIYHDRAAKTMKKFVNDDQEMYGAYAEAKRTVKEMKELGWVNPTEVPFYWGTKLSDSEYLCRNY